MSLREIIEQSEGRIELIEVEPFPKEREPMAESKYPETRNASRQAWRRFSKSIGPGEVKSLAADIAAIIEAEADFNTPAASIEFALTGFNWDAKTQA